MTTAREEARVAMARSMEALDSMSMADWPTNDDMADAISDVWEPLLNDLVTAYSKNDQERFDAALRRAEEALP